MKSKRFSNQIKNKQSFIYELSKLFGPQMSKALTFQIPYTRPSFNKSYLNQIKIMKKTAANYRMAYLTANQVQNLNRVFLLNKLMEKNLNNHTIYEKEEDFQVFINPKIIKHQNPIQIQQTCLIFPFIRFNTIRYDSITLKYKDQQQNNVQQTFQGNFAHKIQHCINHLDGQLNIDYKVSKGRFCVEKDAASYLPKTRFLLNQYAMRLKNQHERAQKNEASLTDESFLRMKQQYLQRLKQIYNKQVSIFSNLIKDKKINIL